MGHSDCEEVNSTLVGISVALWFLVVMASCWFLPYMGKAFVECWRIIEKNAVEGYELISSNAPTVGFDPMHA